MPIKYEAYHTDVQRVIDNLQKMNDVLGSHYIEDAMRMFEVLSFQIKAYSDELDNKTGYQYITDGADVETLGRKI